MTAVALAGSIEVNLAAHAGRVVAVDITSQRAFGFGRIAAGKPADSVIAMVGRLFALCAAAQSVAAITAIEIAGGVEPDAGKARARIAAVVAERMVELLRGTLMTLAGAGFGSLGSCMRRVMTAVRRFEMRSSPRSEWADAIEELEQALAALGLTAECFTDRRSFERWLGEGSPIARLLRPVLDGEDAGLGAHDLEPLDAGADRAIGASLHARGAAFSARPILDGRIPETGALARNKEHALVSALIERHGAGLLVRLVARLVEVCETPARLHAALLAEDDAANADVVHACALECGAGLAAVECARGRLHHFVEMTGNGTVGRLEILAPTEWNFHPRGSLARALEGAPIGFGEAARSRVDRLVAAFDPCVAFRVNVVEVGHA